MQATTQSPSTRRISVTDFVMFGLLCGVIGYSACWVQHRVHSMERRTDILLFANRNWAEVYNGLLRVCVPAQK